MSKNGNRLNTLDVDFIKSSRPFAVGTVLENKLVGSDVFNNNNPEDYVQRADIEDFSSGGVNVWDSGILYDIDNFVSYQVSGIEYIFRSKTSDNIGNAPTESETDAFWQLIGLRKRNLLYDEGDLLDTGGDGNYYLQLPDGISIIESKINNIGYNLTRDNTFTPNRLYGFANNSAQTIQLTVI